MAGTALMATAIDKIGNLWIASMVLGFPYSMAFSLIPMVGRFKRRTAGRVIGFLAVGGSGRLRLFLFQILKVRYS